MSSKLTTTLFSLVFAGSAWCQEARLAGTVTDPSGATLPGATVQANQSERNVSFETKTDASGHYVFPRLPIGTYRVTAEAPGFKTFVQSNLNLTTSLDALLNIVMSIGDLVEKVMVSAEPSRVNTESATLQQLVDSRRIVDLPLNGRDVYQLATLVPGTGQNGTNIGGGKSGSQNSSMLNVRVDGSLNVNNAFGAVLPSPGPDAVQEFTIQTSVPSARYGYAAGVIEVSTKSGTNQLHGTLYEFLRNDKLDARNFFLPTKTKRKRNQYGGAVGGPVVIPKLYNGRDKTFWFVNLEQTKEPLGAATTIFVPTAAQLAGDFSGAGRNINDPLTGRQFPGNQIPANRLDPLALNYLKQFVPAAQDSTGLYRYQRPNDNNPTSFLVRIDQLIASKHQVSGRAFLTRKKGVASAGTLPGVFQSGIATTESNLVGVGDTWTLAPNKINTVRFTYNSTFDSPDYEPKLTLDQVRQLGFSNNYYIYVPSIPYIAVTGYFQGNVTSQTARDYKTYAWSDDFSWIVGRHSLMFGTDGIRTVQFDNSKTSSFGSFTYNGSFSGLGISDFLLSRPSAFTMRNLNQYGEAGLHVSAYFQDDIRINRRLAVNLGIRYELPLPTISTDHRTMFYRPGEKSTVYKNAPTGLLFPGDAGLGDQPYDAKKTFFAPRAGFSYSLTSDQKTVLRAGYGVYYGTSWSNIEGQFAIYQPFTRVINLVAPPSTADPYQNFPGGNPHPYTPTKDAVFDSPSTALAYGSNFREPMMQQWNINLQREIAHDWLATIGYAGTHGTRIPYLRDINQAVYIPGASTVANTDSRRPLAPAFSRFSEIDSAINSSYNSLQASLDRRFKKGVTVLAAYTFSKTLADLNAVLTNDGGVQDANDRHPEWGPADSDRTHAFVMSWLWTVPSGRYSRGLASLLLANWEINGIWSVYSGPPLGFTGSVDRALRGQPNRPDRLKDPRLPIDRPRADLITKYFDTTAIAANKTGQFGNAPRAEGQLRAPGTNSVTAGIFKRFPGFREHQSFQFRTELFNALNRPNFGAPGTSIDSLGSFARITSAADGRIIQFGLKYLF